MYSIFSQIGRAVLYAFKVVSAGILEPGAGSFDRRKGPQETCWRLSGAFR